MRKIMDGKRYDTETAEFVVQLHCPYYGNDFKAHDTGLYRTKRGNWFVAGSGGPLTQWARQVGNGYSGGSGLRPLEIAEARDLLEQHGTPEQVEQYFGAEIEDA